VVGKGTCNGDSGGPILLGDQKTVVGIVSFGSQECELGFPTIYTNVLNYLQWIGETTGMDKLANACPCMNGGTCTGDVWAWDH
jgi:secreted trypsin-like serine protease